MISREISTITPLLYFCMAKAAMAVRVKFAALVPDAFSIKSSGFLFLKTDTICDVLIAGNTAVTIPEARPFTPFMGFICVFSSAI